MSDRTYKGVVTEVFEKDWTDRDTGKEIVLYSFQIEGEKRYFRTGTNKPNFEDGDAISFVADGKTGNVDLKSTKQVKAETVAAPKPKSAPSSSSVGGRDSYWANKEAHDREVTEPRISYSAAQKNATALVAAALASDAISFGSTAKGKKLDMLVDFVEQTTIRLAKLQMDAPTILGGKEEVVDDE